MVPGVAPAPSSARSQPANRSCVSNKTHSEVGPSFSAGPPPPTAFGPLCIDFALWFAHPLVPHSPGCPPVLPFIDRSLNFPLRCGGLCARGVICARVDAGAGAVVGGDGRSGDGEGVGRGRTATAENHGSCVVSSSVVLYATVGKLMLLLSSISSSRSVSVFQKVPKSRRCTERRQ